MITKPTIALCLVLLVAVKVMNAQEKDCCEESKCCKDANCCPNRKCCEDSKCCEESKCCGERKCCENKKCCEEKSTRVVQSSPCPTGTVSSNNTCVSHTNQTVLTTINLINVVNNTNHVYVPINVTTSNVIHINAILPSAQPRDTERIVYVNNRSQPQPVVVTEPSRPLPFPILMPVPFPHPIPYPVPTQQGCCAVVQPCLQGGGCNSYFSMCGQGCTNRVMFSPQNPCPASGCYRRDHYYRQSCQPTAFPGYSNCGYRYQDCSRCGDDFYRDYNSYEACRGCYYR